MEPMNDTTARRTAATRRTVRLRPRPFPAPLGPQLRAALAVAHAREPFRPSVSRDVAQRVAKVAEELGLAPTLFRGGVDVGGAEIDHVWVVIDERVVDAALPLFSETFLAAVRAYVAGDLDGDAFERAAHPYSVRWRVLGAFPADCRYVGSPVWSQRAAFS